MIAGPLRILQLGNAPTDISRLQRALQCAGYLPVFSVVDSVAQLRASLADSRCDVLLLDDVQTGTAVADVAQIVSSLRRDTPIICATTDPTPGAAISAVRAGARAYVAWREEATLASAIDREARDSVRLAPAADLPQAHPNGKVALTLDLDKRGMRERLRGAEAMVRTLSRAVEQSPVSVVITDREGVIEFVNPKFCQVTGYESAEVLYQRPSILKSGYTTDAEYRALWQTVTAGGTWMGTFLNKKKNGDHYWEQANISPIRDERGEITHFVAVKEDITERKWADDALRLSESQYRLLAENSTDLITRLTPDGTVLYASPACKAVLGYQSDELVGHSVFDYWHAEDSDVAPDSFTECLGPLGVETTVHRARHRAGHAVWLETTMRSICDAASGAVVEVQAASRDVTLQRETNVENLARALRTTEERLRTVIAHAPIMLFALDRDGILTFLDGGARFNYESDHASAVGQSIFAQYAGLPHLLDVCRRGLAGESISTMLEIASTVYELWWTPERNELGEVTGGTGLAVDVTASVHAQRDAERARAAALELAELRSDFVSAVSHELRTPLTAIIGYGEMLQARWDVLSEGDRLQRLGRIVLSANRQKRLVEDLLLLSQVDEGIAPPKSAPINIAAVARAVACETRTTYDDQYVELEGADDLFALADRERAIQVLASITDNAAKYSPEGSPILIRWTAEDKHVVIRVFDAGTGIPDQGRDRLFTRFGRIPGSRIRSGHVGTGLGLYMGQRLARAMDGDLDLETTSPNGSVFKLMLPVAMD
jgi:PAS domain S-box-containing protein